MKNISSLFKPKSIAVIGASSKSGKIGNVVVKNLLEGGYKGNIYPINPKEEVIENLKNYKSILDVQDDIDLVVMAIPAASVYGAAVECAKKNVKNMIVLSAGFKEVGGEGVKLEKELVEFCKEKNINILGPNILGSIDTHNNLNATFGQLMPKKGDIAFISQSGAMLVAILDWSISAGIGFSKVVSIGNKADISENDLIEYIANDPDTSVILCYLESISDGKAFLKVVKKASVKKPVIILKSGSSSAGAKAASSHTGALAGSDLAFDLAFKQSGAIRAKNMTELFGLGMALSKLPLPKGENIAVVTNAGGGGVVTADAVENLNLKMAKLSGETIKTLQENLPHEGNYLNPVDVLGDASPERYKFALENVANDKNVDAIIVITCPTKVAKPLQITEEILNVRKKFKDKPIFPVNMGGFTFDESNKILLNNNMPSYIFPETVAEIIHGMTKYSKFLNEVKEQELVKFKNVNKAKIEEIFSKVKNEGRSALLGSEAYTVLESYGISSIPMFLTKSAKEAGEIADKLNYPVVLKIASDKILHKSDVGGVRVNIKSRKEVEMVFDEIMTSVKKALPNITPNGIEVYKMMPKGQEVIIGMMRDPSFGPMIAFGMGGIYVNLIKDASFRLAEGLTKQDIDEQIKETKAYTLLKGYRGEKPGDIEAVKEIIARIAQFTLDFPQIKELDINPVFVYEKGAYALDIKISI